jgi:glycosyltransferase involved in cell wall biosynthesis
MESIKILIFCDWFSPAFKAGGPIRSIVNLVDRFKNQYEIYVFTSDRDLNDTIPFTGILTDQWVEQDGYKIYYHSPGQMTYKKVKSVIAEIYPDKIYLNSMFSNMILPLMAASRSKKIIMAPRGMLRSSALAVKPIRKYFYLTLLRTFNIEQHIVFHSTSEEETKDILYIFPKAPRIIEAPNLPVAVSNSLSEQLKNVGELKMIFVGRIHPIKNLLFLFETIQNVNGKISLDIIATKDDDEYWTKCEKQILALQQRFEINLHIDTPHHQIKPLLQKADLFVLPTEGENFGHAIFEALAVGCPIMISDQTPWQNLQTKKAGIELPLGNANKFSEAIQQFVDMNDTSWQEYRVGALKLARDYEVGLKTEISYGSLFNNGVSK